MSAAALDAALDKIAADNGLTSVTVGRMAVGERIVRTATVHWSGFSRSGVSCEHGSSDQSALLALIDALTKAAADRVPEVVGCDTLPSLEVAA